MRKNNRSATLNNSSETKPQTATRTNWERLDALSYEEIDTSDIPALTDEDFAHSTWRFPGASRSTTSDPAPAVMIEVAVDEDLLAWFQSQGQDYQERIRAALRLYAEAHRASV